jgi:hypothetical protein
MLRRHLLALSRPAPPAPHQHQQQLQRPWLRPQLRRLGVEEWDCQVEGAAARLEEVQELAERVRRRDHHLVPWTMMTTQLHLPQPQQQLQRLPTCRKELPALLSLHHAPPQLLRRPPLHPARLAGPRLNRQRRLMAPPPPLFQVLAPPELQGRRRGQHATALNLQVHRRPLPNVPVHVPPQRPLPAHLHLEPERTERTARLVKME